MPLKLLMAKGFGFVQQALFNSTIETTEYFHVFSLVFWYTARRSSARACDSCVSPDSERRRLSVHPSEQVDATNAQLLASYLPFLR
jgi:hypothetical protein